MIISFEKKNQGGWGEANIQSTWDFVMRFGTHVSYYMSTYQYSGKTLKR